MNGQTQVTPSSGMARYEAMLPRLFVWGVFIALMYVLRSFFLLIFLTFVFSYLQEHIVRRGHKFIDNRVVRVVLVGLMSLGLFAAVGAYIVPTVVNQAEKFVEGFPRYVAQVDKELISLSKEYSIAQAFVPLAASGLRVTDGREKELTTPSQIIFQSILGIGGESEKETFRNVLSVVRNIGKRLVSVASAFFLATLFSFMIVLDLPRLKRGAKNLRRTRVRWVYDEVAESISKFAMVLGMALEAQLLIALANTAFTALIIQILGVGSHTAFLCLVVFLCSFVPVAGVFISSIPICLVVLPVSGLGGVLLAIGLIWLVHLIEAYVLNPRIFGHHLRLNPVLVLIILTISGKLFHVWGLVLSLPVCTYFYQYALKLDSEDANDKV
jgi:predicted PurR-regulated permease PerM